MRLEEGVAPKTVDTEITYIKSMITKGFDNDIVDGRAVKAFRRVKPKLKPGSNARDRILSFDEYIRLLDASPVHLKPILIVAFNTGMREGELLGLRWSHVDKEKGFIRLPKELTKEKRPKKIPMNRHVKRVLDSLPRAVHHDYVFTYKGEPMVRGFLKALRTACEKAGIVYGMKKENGFRFHDIRTSIKTNMLRAGVDKALRDTILGHSLRGMDVYYLKPTEEDLHGAMKQYTEWLDAHLAATVDQTVDQNESSY